MSEPTQTEAPAQAARPSGRPPTVRQIYAIARALCTEHGHAWPATSDEASTLIARLRGE
jgi:hypothetical protein